VETEVPGPAPDVEEVPDPLEVQIPIILEVLEALGICVVGADGYEADDVIGTLATDAGRPVDIVTGDRDLFQLVDDDAEVRVLYIARGVGKHERVTNDWVRAKYDIDAHQYADFATLRGDASDGLPGVAGVGDKTAATLLNRFGDIDGIIAGALDPDAEMGPGPRGKIKAAAAYLEVAPQVVAVARDLALDAPDTALPSAPRDAARVAELAERWRLESPVQRLLAVLGD
jgi:5'-3' exonuclease